MCVSSTGEDRWLCTLLLQQGYRVDYTAASDALTYAPETFNEFFNQRRRWIPSTLANIVDLLSDYKNTVVANDNISYLYMAYQLFLMVSTILGPSTIILAIATALIDVVGISFWATYALNLLPVGFYIAVCYTLKPDKQLVVGAVLSVIYSCIMVVVLVGIIQALTTTSLLNPSLTFIVFVAACFILAGFLHPYEISDLPAGLLYYLCVPAGYLVLMIYSLSNMHIVSWGTREIAKKKTKAQLEKERIEAEKKAAEGKTKRSGFLGWFSRENLLQDVKDIVTQMISCREGKLQTEELKLLAKIHQDLKNMNVNLTGNKTESSDDEAPTQSVVADTAASPSEVLEGQTTVSRKKKEIKPEIHVEHELEDPLDPAWIHHESLGSGPIEYLDTDEWLFWQSSIRKYLQPLKKDAAEEARIEQALKVIRNNASFGFWFISSIWIIFNMMIQNGQVVEVHGTQIHPHGLVFLIIFAILLVIQVFCMFIHRWGTFLQLISVTDLGKLTI